MLTTTSIKWVWFCENSSTVFVLTLFDIKVLIRGQTATHPLPQTLIVHTPATEAHTRTKGLQPK